MASKRQLRYSARDEARAHSTPRDRHALTDDDLNDDFDPGDDICGGCGLRRPRHGATLCSTCGG